MAEWCPKCNAMLPDGTEVCPRCGAKMSGGREGEVSRKDMLKITAYVVGLALIPIAAIILIGFICVSLGN